METLDEHNKRVSKNYTPYQPDIRASVACPKCGTELVYTYPGTETASDPAYKQVNCPNCPFRGMKR